MLYDREVPFEIRNQTDPHDSAQEVGPQCSVDMSANRCTPTPVEMMFASGLTVRRAGWNFGGDQGEDLDNGRGAGGAVDPLKWHLRM